MLQGLLLLRVDMHAGEQQTIRGGRHPLVAFEYLDKVAWVLEAAFEPDLLGTSGGVQEEIAGIMYAPVVDMIYYRFMEGSTKGSTEVVRVAVQASCNQRRADRFVKMDTNILFSAVCDDILLL